MIELAVSTFDELKQKIDELTARFGRHTLATRSIQNPILFRGQANHVWELESTLERASKQPWTLKAYFDLARRIRPIIESYYPLPFSEPSYEEIETWLQGTAIQHGIVNLPAYDYLLYLRHHGFPSPFVDWTTSLYIATGFAFFPDKSADYRTIYMFIETPIGVKGGRVGPPEIARLGPYVKTHKRHFLQQAHYTICFNRADERIPLAQYQQVISTPRFPNQDLLWKFNIPSSERESILKFLASVNINPFSLMPSEENLLSSLWLSEVTLPDYDWARFNSEAKR